VSAHLLRTSESPDWIESRDCGLPLIAEPFEIKDRNIFVPDRPGNSIDWDEDAVRRYAIKTD
jgi:mandelate racemase